MSARLEHGRLRSSVAFAVGEEIIGIPGHSLFVFSGPLRRIGCVFGQRATVLSSQQTNHAGVDFNDVFKIYFVDKRPIPGVPARRQDVRLRSLLSCRGNDLARRQRLEANALTHHANFVLPHIPERSEREEAGQYHGGRDARRDATLKLADLRCARHDHSCQNHADD